MKFVVLARSRRCEWRFSETIESIFFYCSLSRHFMATNVRQLKEMYPKITVVCNNSYSIRIHSSLTHSHKAHDMLIIQFESSSSDPKYDCVADKSHTKNVCTFFYSIGSKARACATMFKFNQADETRINKNTIHPVHADKKTEIFSIFCLPSSHWVLGFVESGIHAPVVFFCYFWCILKFIA